MRERDFNKELYYFFNKIKRGENFSLSRWGDGELMILEGKNIDLTKVKNGEFKYNSSDDEDNVFRSMLLSSFKHNSNNYYIGIACPCCVGNKKFNYMKNLSSQSEENLTWANIFVNSNYNNFIEESTKIFKNKKIIMVVNHQANTSKLPFKVEKTYKVGTNAWRDDFSVYGKIVEYINKNNIKNYLFLFASGPLSNILTYRLWKNNKENTYIDIGSVYDVMMGMKPTRGYLMGAQTLKKKCEWS